MNIENFGHESIHKYPNSRHTQLYYRQTLAPLLETCHWGRFAAITLTLKKRQRDFVSTNLAHTNSNASPYHKGLELNADRAVATFRHFMNQVNQSTYGSAFRRFNRRLRVIPVLEGCNHVRLHYHAAIEHPDRFSTQEFKSLIKNAWWKTDFGNHQIDFKDDADKGWVEYINKIRTKSRYIDAVDIENFHND